MQREECYVTRRALNISIDGYRGRGRSITRYVDYIVYVKKCCAEHT